MFKIDVEVLGVFRFRVQIPSSPIDKGVIVNFLPALIRGKLRGKKNCFLLHLRARPVQDKTLWTWGVYDIDNQTYTPIKHIDSDFGLSTVEVSPKESEPPTHVMVIDGVTAEIRDDTIFFRKIPL